MNFGRLEVLVEVKDRGEAGREKIGRQHLREDWSRDGSLGALKSCYLAAVGERGRELSGWVAGLGDSVVDGRVDHTGEKLTVAAPQHGLSRAEEIVGEADT